jgi:hypothetical protein
MAGLARLTVNNCKANIQSLANELAVEEDGHALIVTQ